MSKLNPYIRIIQAARNGFGIKLNAEECFYLSQDSGISTVAATTREGGECDGGSFIVTKRGFFDKNA